MDICANIVETHTRYDVTSCFRSAFIEVQRTAENAASDGFVCVCIKYNACISIMHCIIKPNAMSKGKDVLKFLERRISATC